MTGAVKGIEKIRRGLSHHKRVKIALKKYNESVDEGPQRDRNNLAMYIIDLNNMLANAKILLKRKDPNAKKYIKLIQQDIKDAEEKLAKI
jgi:hypothetical protein